MPPSVRWSQTDTAVRVLLDYEPADVAPTTTVGVTETGVAFGGRDLHLRHAVDAARSGWTRRSERCVEVTLVKQDPSVWWDRLLHAAGRVPWVSCDWASWKDPDEEADAIWDDPDGVFSRSEWPLPSDEPR